MKSMKIFGIFIFDSYDDILKVNWDYRYKKFSDAIHSWSSRILDTLQQRVEVIRIFALSRVFYVAAVLPVRPSMVKKFESLMGRFIWNYSGKILSNTEIAFKGKNPTFDPEGMRDTSWRSLEIEGKGAVNDQDYFGSGGQ